MLNWEGIVVAIFMSVIVARVFTLPDQVSDLNTAMDPLTVGTFAASGNQSVTRHAFFLELNKTMKRFEARHVR